MSENQTSTALAVIPSDPVALVPRSFAEAQSFAKALAESSLVPTALRNNAANVLMTMMAGAELGIAPIASMRLFHVIEGVPKLTADGIAGLCTRSRECDYLRPKKGAPQTPESVTWVAKRRGGEEIEVTWTREDVKRAGLWDRRDRNGNPGNHQKYPQQMLNARAKAEIARLAWPEIVGGMLSVEEHRDLIEADDAEFVSIPSSSMQPLPDKTPASNPTTLEKPTTKSDPARDEAFAKAREAADDLAKARAEKFAEEEAKRKQEAPPELPSASAEISEEALNEFVGELYAAKSKRELSAVAAKLAKVKLSEAQRADLLKIHKACDAALAKTGGAQ